ncbi:MAG: hypothetical protein IJS68_02975 [Clostridia bacterium]|nr:hypothetical protein [Clostridia bacterium]
MMKKIGKIVIAFLVCVLSAVSLVGCGPKQTATTVDTSKVASNGGAVVVNDGYMYFVNGTTKNDGTSNVSGDVAVGGIYRAKLDESGNVLVDANGNPTDVELVLNSLAGYDNGSLYVFGNYLYYATPNTGKNNKGTVLYNETCFYRYDLTTKKTQRLYTTKLNDSSEEVSHAYYKQGEKLFLMVYEKNQKTLTSVEVNSNITTKVIAKDVQNVLFSENNGEVKDASRNSYAENYVFFTRAALETGAVRSGVRVFKVYPDGSGEKQISEGKSVSLLSIRSDKLLYSCDSKVYLSAISAGEDTLSFENANVVSYSSYDNVVFVEDENGVGVLFNEIVGSSSNIRYLKITNGIVPDEDDNDNRLVYAFDNSTKVEFIGTSGDEVVYTQDGVIYKLIYKNLGSREKDPKKLSTTSCDEASGNMSAEIVGRYVYFFCTLDEKTSLYRATLDVVTGYDENGDPKSAGEATLIGVVNQ